MIVTVWDAADRTEAQAVGLHWLFQDQQPDCCSGVLQAGIWAGFTQPPAA